MCKLVIESVVQNCVVNDRYGLDELKDLLLCGIIALSLKVRK